MALKSKPLEEVRADVPVHEVTREEIVRVNILVPASVRRAWKTAAANSDTTITDMILEAMKIHMSRMKH